MPSAMRAVLWLGVISCAVLVVAAITNTGGLETLKWQWRLYIGCTAGLLLVTWLAELRKRRK